MKRIVICCDGTWNSPREMDQGHITPTNVFKLKEIIRRTHSEVRQLVHYHPGVGTSGSWLRRIWDGATGAGVSDNILEAYCFLIEHYDPGDQLYLFGFSRGAFTARSLAGLIRNSGILRRENIRNVPDAFDLYRSRSKSTGARSRRAAEFRAKFAVEDVTTIQMIGVWDTVGALGNPLFFRFVSPSNRFHDLKLSTAVRNAFQAVAIDEKRRFFRPALWQRQKDVPADVAAKMGVNPDGSSPQRLEQVWFCGTHSNIGGGYDDHKLSDLALGWMIERATECGLQIDYIHTSGDVFGLLRESRIWFYKLLRPYYRPIDHPSSRTVTCETLHPTVTVRANDAGATIPVYDPPNLENYFQRHHEAQN